jgi:hypothetical protein
MKAGGQAGGQREIADIRGDPAALNSTGAMNFLQNSHETLTELKVVYRLDRFFRTYNMEL